MVHARAVPSPKSPVLRFAKLPAKVPPGLHDNSHSHSPVFFTAAAWLPEAQNKRQFAPATLGTSPGSIDDPASSFPAFDFPRSQNAIPAHAPA